jgi:hypothetical protein
MKVFYESTFSLTYWDIKRQCWNDDGMSGQLQLTLSPPVSNFDLLTDPADTTGFPQMQGWVILMLLAEPPSTLRWKFKSRCRTLKFIYFFLGDLGQSDPRAKDVIAASTAIPVVNNSPALTA